MAKILIVLVSIVVSGCAVNPVTGESQLLFSSPAEDIHIGQTQYQPAQQSQGGSYNLDPGLSAYVSEVGNKLAAVSDQPALPYEFVILNNSIPNAWALPSGKIALNRGLLVQLKNESQLAAVMSHEIVHAAARHGAQRMRDNLLMQAGMAGLGLTLADNDYRELIIGGATLGANLTVAKYGRDHELESDHYGMKYMAKAGYDLQGAVELQQLFLALSKGQRSSWLDGLFASHPPSQERVSENIKTAQALQVNKGKTGKVEFEKAMSYLRSKQKAYDHADQAAKAMHKKQYDRAISLIENALQIEPREALFHSIKGEALQIKGQNTNALASHNRAIELNPNQFSYYLKRAVTEESLGNTKAAKYDYEKSMSLLPTSVAAVALGQLFESQGQTQQALSLYSQAASATGRAGEQARINIAKLEIHQKPEKYLNIRHIQDPKGPLLIQIENRGPLDIKKISFVTETFDPNGKRMTQDNWTLADPLVKGGKSKYLPVKSVYHLAPAHTIKTTIRSIALK